MPELIWGSVGTHHQEGIFEECGGPGVRCIAGDGVDYYPPPLTWHWAQVRDNPQHYVLAWTGNPRQVRTLARLGEELRTARDRRDLTADSASLRQFDRLIQQLLVLAGDLHTAGWHLGLVHPENILISESEHRQEPVLVDLGFVWNGGIPAPWIENNPFQHLWETNDLKTRQHAEPVLSAGEEIRPRDPAAVAADLRMMARLLALVLTGTTTVVTHLGASPVWKTLQAAMDNRFASAREFAAALETTPPSGHFLRRPWLPLWILAVAGVLAVAVLAAFVAPFVWRGAASRPAGSDKDVSSLAQMLDRVAEVPAAEVPPLLREISDAPKDLNPTVEARRLQESQAAWKRYCTAWLSRYHDLLQRLNREYHNFDLERFHLSKELQQLHDELVAEKQRLPNDVATLTEEQQRCLTDAAQQAKELGLQ